MVALVGMTCTAMAADGDNNQETVKTRYQQYLDGKTNSKQAVRRYSRDRAAAIKNYRKLFEAEDEKAAQTPTETAKDSQVQHAAHVDDAKGDEKIEQVAGRRSAPKAPVFSADYKSRLSGRKNYIHRISADKTEETIPSVEPAAPQTSAPSHSVSSKSSTGAATVELKWEIKEDVNVGQECECSLIVKNPSNADAHEVVVDAIFPNSVRLLSAKPDPSESVDRLVWKFDELRAGSQTDIRIRLIPSIPGELAASANVRFTGTSELAFKVAEPLLKITMKGPDSAVVGDPATQMVTVSNPGTGVAQNVVLQATIPEGLEHSKGSDLSIGVGSLGPGESRSIRLAMAAVSGGDHIVLVQAEADGGLKQRAASRIDVIAPSLDVAIDGPSLRYINREGKYKLTVTNDGGAASNNVRIYHEIPEGFEFVKASNGGKADSTGKGVTWYVGHLEAGQSVDVTVDLVAKTIGDFKHNVRVTSDEGGHKQIEMASSVEGSAALVMEVDDRDDPVEVGSETWIEARVENRGTKAAANMGISIELPTGVELINAEGPSEHIAENGLLIFKSIDQLQPAEAVTYRLRVTGSRAGNLRFRARLTSDSIQQPLIVEELTKFYDE